MLARVILGVVALVVGAGWSLGQTASPAASNPPPSTWRGSTDSAPGGGPTAAPSAAAAGSASGAAPPAASAPAATSLAPGAAQPGVEPAGTVSRQPIARVTAGSGSLPNEHGQLWREYDISPYTLRVTTTNRPQQAIVDWILRETGYEVWHGEPFGVLSASHRVLRVYHTPEVQAVVADIVDRFVASQAESHAFGLQVVTLDSPNWRARAQRILRPVQVQAPGVQAWVMSKEDAAMLIADLRRRNDYREHSSPHLLVNNGQSTVVSATRGRSYVRGVKLRPEAWPGFEPETALIDEGFALEFSPLLSVDARTIDAVIKCDVDQVEKLVPVVLDVPTPVAPRQRAKIEVPQVNHFRFHERFRWPVEQVLLIDMGVVALPLPVDGKPLVAGLPLPLPSTPARADMLVFVESKGKLAPTPQVTRGGLPDAKTYQGRY